MSENTNTANWESIVASDSGVAEAAASTIPAPRASAAAAPSNNLPPFPQGVSYLIGRLPITCDTAVAVLTLPEPIKGISCAVVLPNSGVLSDCHNDSSKKCVPNALRAYPINDRAVRVVLDAPGDKVTTGPGWVEGGYPGSLPTTLGVEVGVPYVEVVVFVGVDCGCSSENWAPDTPEWG